MSRFASSLFLFFLLHINITPPMNRNHSRNLLSDLMGCRISTKRKIENRKKKGEEITIES